MNQFKSFVTSVSITSISFGTLRFFGCKMMTHKTCVFEASPKHAAQFLVPNENHLRNSRGHAWILTNYTNIIYKDNAGVKEAV